MIDLRNLTPAQIEAYNLALSAENNDFFKDKIKKFKEAQNQEFNDSMGSYRASSQEKESFQDLLSQYLIYIENTHRSFFEKGNTKANGTLKFISKDAYTNFCNWLERAGIANTKLKGFKQEFKEKVRDAIGEQRAQNAKKIKRRLTALSGMLIGAALGTGTFFGTEAAVKKFQNSEDNDTKTDRIEHRVKVATPTVQEKGYVQDAYEEVVIQDEVRHQTEEVRQPQQHEIIEEVVEEVAPRRVIQEPDIVIPGKVIQEPDTIIPGRVIHQPDVVVPAPTTYVQPATTVIQQQPAVTVIDNSSPVADFVGAAAGAFVGHVIADHLDGHHRGHGRRNAFFRPKTHHGGGMSGIMKRASRNGGSNIRFQNNRGGSHGGFGSRGGRHGGGHHGGRHGGRR